MINYEQELKIEKLSLKKSMYTSVSYFLFFDFK